MSGITESEFQSILSDSSKQISGDINWLPDEDHSPTVEFRATVDSDTGYPLLIRGSYNHEVRSISYVMLHAGSGRIYALDLGKDHRNPDGTLVGEKHKHRWSEQFRDREAYVPTDITAGPDDPVTVWRQFCAEANLKHHGKMNSPLPPPTLFE